MFAQPRFQLCDSDGSHDHMIVTRGHRAQIQEITLGRGSTLKLQREIVVMMA